MHKNSDIKMHYSDSLLHGTKFYTLKTEQDVAAPAIALIYHHSNGAVTLSPSRLHSIRRLM